MENRADFILSIKQTEKTEDAFFNMLPRVFDNNQLAATTDEMMKRLTLIARQYDDAWVQVRKLWLQIKLNRFGVITVDTYKMLITAIEDTYIMSVQEERAEVLESEFARINHDNMTMLSREEKNE